MTSEALTTTVTAPLALMPSSSTASLVMEEVMIWPPPISTRTCEVVAPFFTSTTVPLIWLRALMRMISPSQVYPAHDDGPHRQIGNGIGSVALIQSFACRLRRGDAGH